MLLRGGGNSVTGIPEPKTVEKGTVLKVDDLPTLTEPEGWTFEGWYIGEEPFTSDYTVTSNIIITAKFVENVAPSLPEDPVEPDTTNNFNGNYYAGEDDMGYIEFTNETDCVVFVVSAVPATYTVADNVATIKGVRISDEEDYSAIEIKTTILANDSFSVTYPVEICQRFDPDASENMVITYTKVDNPSSGGGGAVVVPDPVETFLVTYTVVGIDANLVTGLPETGNVNKDTVLSLSPLEAPEGYVFDGWFINDELVSQHTVDADVTIVAKFSAIVPVGTTYTIPDINAEWTNVAVWAWDNAGTGEALPAENNEGTVTFQTNSAIIGCLVVKLRQGFNEEVKENIWNFRDGGETDAQTSNYYLDSYIATYSTEGKILLKPSSNWLDANARFAAYFFNNTTNSNIWVDMTETSSFEKIYEVTIPEGYPNVIFCRMNPDTEENDWGTEGSHKWNQSPDLDVENNEGKCFIVSGWDEGMWSTIPSFSLVE